MQLAVQRFTLPFDIKGRFCFAGFMRATRHLGEYDVRREVAERQVGKEGGTGKDTRV